MDRALDKEASAERCLQKGNYLFENREFDQAIDAFQRSAKLNPDCGKTHLFKGYAACEINRWELAKRSFEKAREFEDFQCQERTCFCYGHFKGKKGKQG